ncbi:MAG: hypothetical protein WA417_22705 [Stellaceae bacterium]
MPALSTTSDRPTGPAMPARPAATPDRPDKSEPAATPEQHNARLVSAWNARRTEAAGRYADYEAVAESPNTPISVPMTHAIVNSKYGPDIAYWLGQHREKAAQIAAMTNPVRQALEIGRIEARVRRQLPSAPAPAARPAGSRSTEPVQPAAGGNQSGVERYLAELRKGNRALGWGKGGG